MLKLKTFLLSIIFLICFVVNIFATEIVVFHTNDVHGRIEQNKELIGYATMATIINNTRKENAYVLFLDAGDTLHGTVFANLNRGEAIVEILNTMKLDAMTLGNHDFNYGIEQLYKLNKMANFLMLSANVTDDSGKNIFQQYTIKKFGDITVGIFGISTPETLYKTNPNNIRGLTFLDVKKVAQEQVNYLKQQGVDFIIALSHLGLDDASKPVDRSTHLATVEGIDLIIDGHSHTILPRGEKHSNSMIVQTGSYGENLGKVVITIDNKKTIKSNISPALIAKADTLNIISDKAIMKIINKYNQKNQKILDTIISNTEILLDGTRDNVRSGETNLGMLIADALRSESKSDIAFINGGGIRDSIKIGDISYKNILAVLPFNNILVKVEVSGSVIKEALEKSVEYLPNASGSFLHISGISFHLDITKKVGERVSNIKIGNKNINYNSMYTVALPDFISVGGDGYTMFKGATVLSQGTTIDEVLMKYLTTYQISPNDFTRKIQIKSN